MVLVTGGVSMWPKADTFSVVESTLYEDRFGWNLQPQVRVDVKVCGNLSVFFTAGYLFNTTMLREIYITHDMLLLSLGPRICF